MIEIGILTYIIIIIGLIFAFSYFQPNLYDSTIGQPINMGIDYAKGLVGMHSVIAPNITTAPTDLGLPYITENVSFIKCTSDNVCLRIYGDKTYCNNMTGHCYK